MNDLYIARRKPNRLRSKDDVFCNILHIVCQKRLSVEQISQILSLPPQEAATFYEGNYKQFSLNQLMEFFLLIKRVPQRRYPNCVPSCGNIFEDLGLPYPERELVKSCIWVHTIKHIQDKRISIKKAANLLNMTESQFKEFRRRGNGTKKQLLHYATLLNVSTHHNSTL